MAMNQRRANQAQNLKDDLKKLSDNIRIQETFQAMNDVERERFETWRTSNIDEKKMKKVSFP